MSYYLPAHDAVEADDLEKLRQAIRVGADVEAEECGQSLLQHAIDVESQGLLNHNRLAVDMTAFLLDAGADPLRPAGDDGTSAQQLAMETGHWKATDLIEEWIRAHPRS